MKCLRGDIRTMHSWWSREASRKRSTIISTPTKARKSATWCELTSADTDGNKSNSNSGTFRVQYASCIVKQNLLCALQHCYLSCMFIFSECILKQILKQYLRYIFIFVCHFYLSVSNWIVT